MKIKKQLREERQCLNKEVRGKTSSQRKTILELKDFFELPGSRDQKQEPPGDSKTVF